MVIASASTFVFVLSLYTPMKSTETPLSSKAVNRYSCAYACDQLEECGGIVWDENAVPRCKLVSLEGEGPDVQGKVYRKLTFRGQKLIQLHTEIGKKISIRNAFDACSAIGTVPVPIPRTVQEKTVLQIRSASQLPLGVIREGDTAIFTDLAGETYDISDTTLYSWSLGDGTQSYVILRNEVVKDYGVTYAMNMCLYCLTDDNLTE